MTPMLESSELEIPDNIRMTYRRMLYRTPRDIREDQEFQHKLLTFLKLGNESAARQYIAIRKVKLIEQLSLIKRHARDVVEVQTEDDDGEIRVESGTDAEIDVEGDAPSQSTEESGGNDDPGNETQAAAQGSVPQDPASTAENAEGQATDSATPTS